MSRAKPATSSSKQRDERGSVSIELVILLPALFAVMFLGMQAALFYHARTVAIAAAQEGAKAAGGEDGKESDGASAAYSFIVDAGGGDVLTGASATANRTATTVTVTVTGHSLNVIPGWSPLIVQSASLPVERLTAPSREFTNSEGSSGGN
jgi:Flp pilus assembly protein TadG